MSPGLCVCDTCTSTATAARGSGNSGLNSSVEQRLLKALQLVLAGRILQSEGMAADIGCMWLLVMPLAGLENPHFMCDMWALSWPWPLWLWEVDL